MSEDPYSRVDYRRFVAWPKRLQREWDLLRRVLDQVPDRSLLDLGCGTGEHARFLGGIGFRVLAVDNSENMLSKAAEVETPPNVRFVLGDIRQLRSITEELFGAAICLGNTLVHLTEEAELRSFLDSLRLRVLPGGIFLLQILNYDRIFQQGVRYLPLNFREGENGVELLFLRLMNLFDDGTVLFCPSTLTLDPGKEEPLTVVKSQVVRLRGWKKAQLLALLEETGWIVESVFGNMERGSYSSAESMDLVITARIG